MGSLDILPCNSTHPCTLAEGDCDHDDQVKAVCNFNLHNPPLALQCTTGWCGLNNCVDYNPSVSHHDMTLCA